MKPVILCVDDEKYITESLKEQLSYNLNGEFVIETADNGKDALEILSELEEDELELGVIISDYIMPGMKGDELLTRVHKRSPKTLKILLTGQADLQAVGDTVNKANLYRYITKPWEAIDLAMTVKEALLSFSQTEQLSEQNQQLITVNKELSSINKAYARFIPKEFLELLGQDSITHVNLGDQKKYDMSILFADIRSFTQLSEMMTQQENFNFINSYLNKVSPCIRHHKGFIDKYLGDGLMALFPSSAEDAIMAAIDMQNKLDQYNIERKAKNRIAIEVGVGIHDGMVMLGTVGEEERMDSTVISDAVNIASRLERLTKRYSSRIITSFETILVINDRSKFDYRPLHSLTLEGKKRPTRAMEILNAYPDEEYENKMKTLDIYKKAHDHYVHKEYSMAYEGFKEVLSIDKADIAASIFFEECSVLM